MNSIANLIGQFPVVQNGRVLDVLSKKKNITLSGAGNYSAKVFTFADAIRKEKNVKTVLWVVNDMVEQEHVVRSLRLWTDLEVQQFNLLAADSGNVR